MDVTGGLAPAITAAVGQLPSELKPLFDGVLTQALALEAKINADALGLEKTTASDLKASLADVLQRVDRFAEQGDRLVTAVEAVSQLVRGGLMVIPRSEGGT